MSGMFSGPFGQERHQETSFPDPAFEPHQNFMFDEVPSDDDFQNMQRSISAFNDFKGDEMEDNSFMSSDFFGQEMGSNANAPSRQSGQLHLDLTSQVAIVNERGASVVQHHGQITPPDDSTPFAASTATDPEAKMNAKSERARNAANQRHAKAKKARKDSARIVDSTAEAELEVVDDRREKYREKNRLAAAKCRAKKKNNTEDLEESARIISSTNNRLRAEERELRDIFSSLRDQALSHDSTQGCTCSAIHMYNNHKAQEAVRGAAMGLAAYTIPSPSLDSIGSARSRTRSEVAGTQSFSDVKAGCFAHLERSNSRVDMLRGYLPHGVQGQQSSTMEGLETSSSGLSPLVGSPPSLTPLGEESMLSS